MEEMQQSLALDAVLVALVLIKMTLGILVVHHVLWVQAFQVVYPTQLILIAVSVLSALY